MKNRYLEAGQIVNTHGIIGEVKIIPWADSPDFLLDFSTLYIDEKPVHVRASRIHKNTVLAFLEGVNDVNDAMRLKDKIVCIDREDASIPKDRHFIVDLIGLEVRDADTNELLGTIYDVLTPPSHEVYVVRGGKEEHMIPAVDAFVIETNVDDGYIRVRLIEGM
ncbi:MAG: ribosome maturation factor RimM [Evtepia sp.]